MVPVRQLVGLTASVTGSLLLLAAFPGFALRGEESEADRATTLLATKCLSCHNAKTKAGGFDFERRTHALTVLAPGKIATSQVLRVVREGKMPPTGKLPSQEVTLLSAWIAKGATYPKEPLAVLVPSLRPLWSFQPVKRPSIPTSPYDRLAKNPIDRFLFARLASKKLSPSPPASRLALLRRVSIDLTGLPPTPEEIQSFLKDHSPNAYAKVVDRLLASPAYGERWGRHWLDIVRYGESHGYEQNHLRPNSWPYRDYVIRAFNQDKPYNRFLTEQLAGDVVGKGDPLIEPATGFLVAGIHDTVGIQTEEGTRQQRSNDLDDMVSTTGAAFLGLTIGCAKCHDHKFDPIPQWDYYRLTAVFAGVRHGERPITTRAATEQELGETEEINRKIQSLTNRKGDIETVARTLILQRRGKGTVTRPAVNARRNTDDFAPVTAQFVRFQILVTLDGTEPCLDEVQIYGPESDQNYALASAGAKATASSLLPGFPIHQIAHLNDGKLGNEWSWISQTAGTGWIQIALPRPTKINRVVWSRDAGDIPRFDDRIASVYRIEVSEDGKNWHTVSTEAGRASAKEIVSYAEILAAMTPQQQQERQRLTAELEVLKKRADALRPGQQAYIGQFTVPDNVFLLRRGDVMQPVEKVTPGALSQVKTLTADLLTGTNNTEAERRLSLARWITDPRNPLTPRVLVNRLWQYHFGRGLVSTPSDFGHNGEAPSHPELLDWLAATFIGETGQSGSASLNCGWSLKKLHRLMVLSYAYQQSSSATPKGVTSDAGNTLLWRMPLRRMEAEAIRDTILTTSGKLDRKMGGPGYRLFQYNVVNVAIYSTLENYSPETWRRSVYQQAARAIHDPLLGAFDCPETSQRAPRRESTTTALQSLALLNGSFMTQQADFFAERVRQKVGDQPARQVTYAFTLAFGRPPTLKEQTAALRLADVGGLSSLCRALMNANEFLYY